MFDKRYQVLWQLDASSTYSYIAGKTVSTVGDRIMLAVNNAAKLTNEQNICNKDMVFGLRDKDHRLDVDG